eukprot:4319741-Pyramimonas_sp.AAC.2
MPQVAKFTALPDFEWVSGVLSPRPSSENAADSVDSPRRSRSLSRPSLALALRQGGEITSTFDSPDQIKLGECKLIEEIMIGEDKMIHFSGVAKGDACTIVLRGASTHLLDEAERSLHDALCVLQATVLEPR